MIKDHVKLKSIHMWENTIPVVKDSKIVDPYLPADKEEEDLVINRCKDDIWYFLKYVLHLRENNIEMTLRAPDPAGEALIFLYGIKQSAVFLGTRQVFGKTTLLLGLYYHYFLFGPETQLELTGPNIHRFDYMSDKFALPYYFKALKKRNFIVGDSSTEKVYFIDDIMHNTSLDGLKEGNCTYFGVGTLGPENADLIRTTIPFTNEMYGKDIRKFAKNFRKFTGYSPAFLIIANDVDIEKTDSRKCDLCRLKRTVEEDSETYRREISCEPIWTV